MTDKTKETEGGEASKKAWRTMRAKLVLKGVLTACQKTAYGWNTDPEKARVGQDGWAVAPFEDENGPLRSSRRRDFVKCSCGNEKDTAKQLITCPVCNEEILAFTEDECVWAKFTKHLDDKHPETRLDRTSVFGKVVKTRYNRHFLRIERDGVSRVSDDAIIQMLGYLPFDKFADGLRNGRLTVWEAFHLLAEMDARWDGRMVEEMLEWLQENPQVEVKEGRA